MLVRVNRKKKKSLLFSKVGRKVFLLLISVFIFQNLSMTSFSDEIEGDETSIEFTVQPMSKNIGRFDTTTNVSVSYKDGTFAKLSDSCNVYLQYQDDSFNWHDAETTVTTNADGTIAPIIISTDSELLNKNLRLLTEYGIASDTFMIAGNYTLKKVPDALYTVDSNHILAFDTGDMLTLCPDIDAFTDDLSIVWQVSTDKGKSYSDIETIDSGIKASLVGSKIKLSPSDSGNLYRYYKKGTLIKEYSDPYEVFVFEKYSVSGNKLTVTEIGEDGSVNDYTSGSRLYGFRPWEGEASKVKSVEFSDSVTKIGGGAFSDFTLLNEAKLNKVTEIGPYAFKNTLLRTITIPKSVQSIEKGAFQDASLVDIRFINPKTQIDMSEETIPLDTIIYGYEGIAKDDVHGISETTKGSTAFSYALENDRKFYPIGVKAIDGIERYVDWKYVLEDGKVIRFKASLDTRSAFLNNGIDVYIPPTIDGYFVEDISGLISEDSTRICGLAEHIHAETCFNTAGNLRCGRLEHTHEDSCYSDGNYNIFGFEDSEEAGINIENLYIPENISEISYSSFNGVSEVKNIYDYSDTHGSVSYNFINDEVANPTGTIYSYASNFVLREKTFGYNYELLDSDKALTGAFGECTYTINLRDNTLTISGNGSTGNLVSSEDSPFSWAKEEITKIVISEGVLGLGDNAFGALTKVSEIENRSSVLKSVSESAFLGCGTKSTVTNKLCTTFVNNEIFDAINKLNKSLITYGTDYEAEVLANEALIAENEAKLNLLSDELETVTDEDREEEIIREQEELYDEIDDLSLKISNLKAGMAAAKFNFVFVDSTLKAGENVEAIYSALDHSLTLKGTNDGKMKEYSSNEDVPWRAVNNLITKLNIESSVKAVSNNAFHNLTNLKEVYNYGRDQELIGSGEMFDVIKRKITSLNDEYVIVDAPKRLGADTADYELQLTSIAAVLRANGMGDFTDTLLNRKLTCEIVAHTHMDECKDALGNIVCGIEEHVHLDSCYISLGDPINVEEGTYYIPKSASSEEVVNILTGEATNNENYIVPVYTMGDSNKDFSLSVPPESDGYKLMDIFKLKGQCGDDLFYYISIDNTLVIEGTGDMYDFEKGKSPWSSYVGVITDVKLPDELTTIGSFAFEGIELIIDIKIPDKVKHIGTGAFIDCVNLNSFNINNVKSMGGGVFSGCTQLNILNINSNFYINDGALYDSSNNLLCYIRESLFENIEEKTYYEAVKSFNIPTDTKAVAEYAFYKAADLRDVIIPKTVTMIKDYAFSNTPRLNSLHNDYEDNQTIAVTALDNAGYEILDGKYCMVYKKNTNFEKVALNAGYKIIYNDEEKIDHIAVAYTGDAVAIGRSFDANKVQVAIVYVSNESEVITGKDEKVSFSTTIIKNAGDNIIEVFFNDGYGQEYSANVYIPGKNTATGMEVAYKGPTLYYNNNINLSDVIATITYADGSTKSITANTTYNTSLGQRKYLSLDRAVVSKVGDNEITVTYLDADGMQFTGKIKIKALNYLTEIRATYDSSSSIEISKGIEGIDIDRLTVELIWSDESFENVRGSDYRIHILPDYTVSGDKLIFEVTCSENNPNELVAGFSVAFENTIRGVDFLYVGDQVTKNMTFSFADVELTITYTDDTVTKVRGDSVSGLSADHTTIQTADSTEEVEMYYEVGGETFTGRIYVPGKIREPLKLIVATRPKKTVYQEGDSFDKTGMVINCLYNDGNTEDVTDKITIEGGTTLSSATRIITLIYADNSTGATVRTNMSINVNEFQKEVSTSRNFKEQYEITHVYFRTKVTSDLSNGITSTDTSEEEDGEWIEITPANNTAVFEGVDNDGNEVAWPDIKTGYGFELKVYTQYRTDRAGEEFSEFLNKAQWDSLYTDGETPSISSEDINSKWKYLNDVYPQYTPTSNPDLLYLRIQNGNISLATGGEKDYTEFDGKGFLILERTDCPIYVNADDENPERIAEGEWYNSTKVFELPSRNVMGDGVYARRVYVSTAAANNNLEYTPYGVQIISPAWYGYEPEPIFEGDKFHYITEPDVGLERKKMWAPGKRSVSSEYLHVCCQFYLRVRANDDVRTHILQ